MHPNRIAKAAPPNADMGTKVGQPKVSSVTAESGVNERPGSVS